ncbi:hypothetical protein V8C26DRAFT_392866 [Trichoderma gracile]
MSWTLVGMLRAPSRQLAETSFRASSQRRAQTTRQRPTPVRLADESQLLNLEALKRLNFGCRNMSVVSGMRPHPRQPSNSLNLARGWSCSRIHVGLIDPSTMKLVARGAEC